jgi:hypothetical protein
MVTKLAKTDLIKAAVLLHPSWITLDDIKGMTVNANLDFIGVKLGIL